MSIVVWQIRGPQTASCIRPPKRQTALHLGHSQKYRITTQNKTICLFLGSAHALHKLHISRHAAAFWLCCNAEFSCRGWESSQEWLTVVQVGDDTQVSHCCRRQYHDILNSDWQVHASAVYPYDEEEFSFTDAEFEVMRRLSLRFGQGAVPCDLKGAICQVWCEPG